MNNELRETGKKAKEASYALAAAAESVRNLALDFIADGLLQEKERIFAANQADVAAAKEQQIGEQMIQRLRLGDHKLADAAAGLRDLKGLPDPLGQVSIHTELADGLTLKRISCPIGVVGVIFEARPDALIQIAGLCLKSGNAVILKGGAEAARTNQVLFDIICKESARAGLPAGWIHLLRSREEVREMLQLDEDIDLIIPRGSNAFVRYIMENTRIPVLGHSSGVCSLYLDATADPRMAAKLAVDSKTQYPAACNSIETLLYHPAAADAMLSAAQALTAQGVQLKADTETQALLQENGIESTALQTEDLGAEYGDLILNVVRVPSLNDAIAHINRYGSHHTDCIVTGSAESAARFQALVDSAGVYHNCSTRFADGYRYGFGAEVGISTGKIHARGPMGMEGLCSYKYVLEGHGDCVADFAENRRSFTHVTLP